MLGGKVVKVWFARVTYFDEQGKRREWLRRSDTNTKTAARELAREMLDELEGQGRKAIDASKMTFAHLADFYEETYLIDPEYVDGRKVAGYRGKYVLGIILKTLKGYFGKYKIREITHGDIKKFKAVKLKTPAVFGKNTRGTEKGGKIIERQRSVATVHKELSLIRRILNVAVSIGISADNEIDRKQRGGYNGHNIIAKLDRRGYEEC